jgi:hypothetical protein
MRTASRLRIGLLIVEEGAPSLVVEAGFQPQLQRRQVGIDAKRILLDTARLISDGSVRVARAIGNGESAVRAPASAVPLPPTILARIASFSFSAFRSYGGLIVHDLGVEIVS